MSNTYQGHHEERAGLNNLEVFVAQEIFHLNERRRRKIPIGDLEFSELIRTECREYLAQPRADIKPEQDDDYLEFPGQILPNLHADVKIEPTEEE